MAAIQNLFDFVGGTPLLQVEKNIFAKLEFLNPGGSIKDRAALAMIRAAENAGELKPGGLIVEASSGNTGIALAWIAAQKKYRIKICLPENFSVERQKILRQLGAEIILTSAAEGMAGAIREAAKLAEKENGWQPRQFENPANIEIHATTTGPEIFAALPEIQIFVAGVGTGGTISGVGRFLKSQNSSIRIIAVEPAESAVLSGGICGNHKIEGIGAGFIPKNFDSKVVDEIAQISSAEALAASKFLAREKGILAGISSGANFAAARKLASKFPDQKIATVFPDGGERYLSTELFD
ncbi:cysteine synthase A [Patescibacteria group bacterium]|nr:cysteine synthase A [Patescibacteria group bacterium]